MLKEEGVREYLNQSSALIVEGSDFSRNRLVCMIQDLGVRSEQIISVKSFVEAANAQKSQEFNLKFYDWKIGSNYFFEYLRDSDQRASLPRDAGLKCLITSNSNFLPCSKAVEENIDLILIKPYTKESLMNRVRETLMGLLYPDPFHSQLEKGKKSLLFGNPGKAKAVLERAARLNPNSPIAYYYLGIVSQKLEEWSVARKYFKKSYELNSGFFTGTQSYFETLMNEGEWELAQGILKTLITYYPLDANRLIHGLKLAVKRSKFEEIHAIFDLFLQVVDEYPSVRNEPALEACVSSALITLGKYYLKYDKPSSAVDCFQKAISFGYANTQHKLWIIESFLLHDQLAGAKEFLKKAPWDGDGSVDYHIAEFLVSCGQLSDQEFLSQAKQWLPEGRSFYLHWRACQSLANLGDDQGLQRLVSQGVENWPHQKSSMERLLGAQSQHRQVSEHA